MSGQKWSQESKVGNHSFYANVNYARLNGRANTDSLDAAFSTTAINLPDFKVLPSCSTVSIISFRYIGYNFPLCFPIVDDLHS